MNETVRKDGKTLRLGYTTGSCAAGASKAAAFMLLSGIKKEKISLVTPKGIELNLDVHDIEFGEGFVSCAIEKDSGDDPDITKGAYIYAKVSKSEEKGVHIDGGFGVGRVTKRGLDQPPGNAAINSVPRKMIEENAREIMKLLDYDGGLDIIISVPEGEKLAKKTFNPRLGIVGGISILGTSGIVDPMSEKALLDTIRVELRQRREMGSDYVLLTPGNYGADFIKAGMKLDPSQAVMTSNFIGDSLEMCVELGFKGALLIGHIGKMVKIAGGMLNTHSKYGDCRMDIMTATAAGFGLPADTASQMLECASCDDAIRLLDERNLREKTLEKLTGRIDFILKNKLQERMEIGAMLFSKEYGLLSETIDAQAMLCNILKG
ncbi:MAG: cobalt-precorrin-5B (C(1))-methyltransferase CbiD [Oscillospiraceae bacterium]|nr:cobalt-precorrin-5B (C(1))-methyltransferase CbiD [Oscillospiraceae bacterium]